MALPTKKPVIYSRNRHCNKLQKQNIIDCRRTPTGAPTRLRHNWQKLAKKGLTIVS